jgi:hypothetical protein
VQITIDKQLVKCYYIVAVTTGVWASSSNDRFHSRGKSDTLKQALEERIDTGLQMLIKAKSESEESVTSFAVEEWWRLITQLESTYIAWIAERQTS